MVQLSHQERHLPKIKVRLTSVTALDLTLVAWKVAERLWRKYGIEIEVEDDPYYLVNPVAGVGYGTGGVNIVIEDPDGIPLVYDFNMIDYEDPVEGLEHFVLRILTQGVPVIGEDRVDSLIDRDYIIDLAVA